MNPMVSSGSRRGAVARFEPPWGEAVCVVTLDDGTWGLGLTAHAGPVVPMINDYLGPLIEREPSGSVADIGELWDLMSTVGAAHLGTGGILSYAISAVDLALYDALWSLWLRPARGAPWQRQGLPGDVYLFHDEALSVFGFGPAFAAALSRVPESARTLRAHRDGDGDVAFRSVRFHEPHRLLYRAETRRFEVRLP